MADPLAANDFQSDGSPNDSDTQDEDDPELAREILALCLRGSRLGCARYRPLQCRVEVFEVPVFLGVEVATSASTCGTAAPKSSQPPNRLKRMRAGLVSGARLLHADDVPPSLLWLYQYVELHTPIALLPDSGAELLADVLELAQCSTVLRLGAETGFDELRALPQLSTMYPHLSETDLQSRFNQQHGAMMAAMAAMLQYVGALHLNVADVVERGPVSILYVSGDNLRAWQVTRQDAHPCRSHRTSRAKEGLSLFSVLDQTVSSMGRALLRQWLLLPSCDAALIKNRQDVVALFLAPQHHEVLVAARRALRGFHNTNHLFTLIRRGRGHRRHYQSLHQTLRAILTVHELVGPVAHESPLLFDLVANHCRRDILQEMLELLQRTVYGICDAKRSSTSHVHLPSARLPETSGYQPDIHDDCHLSINSEADETGLLGELRLHLQSLGSALECHARAAFDALDPAMRDVVAVRCVYVSPYGYLICASRVALCSAIQRTMVASGVCPTSSVSAAAEARQETGPATTTATDTDTVAYGDSSELHDFWPQTVGYLQQRYGWSLHHEDDGTDLCYFKTAVMSDLDAKVGDLRRRIAERECELRRSADELLLYLSLHLLAPSRAMAVLDCLLTLSHVAHHYQWCRPRIVEDRAGVVDIHGGWHPVLCQAVGASVVQPFSLRLGASGDSRVCVVTGQNGSGKSVLLSAVAHMVLLAQMGSFVPATAASLSVFGSLWSSYGSRSVGSTGALGASSFAAECVAVSRILRYCDAARAANAGVSMGGTQQAPPPPAPLVLLDEFGKGTAADDGRALLGAVIRYVSASQYPSGGGGELSRDPVASATVCASVICATHYIDMLWDGERQSLFPAVAFPYERVMLVDMRAEPVYNEAYPRELEGSAVDVVPTFQPVVVTPRAGHHQQDFMAYRSRLLVDAAVGGREAGLPEELLELWQKSLAVLATPT